MNSSSSSSANATALGELPSIVENMSPSVLLHIIAVALALLLVLPFAQCARQPPTTHKVVYFIFLFMLTIAVGAGLTTSFHVDTAVHSLGGFAVYLALLATYMNGASAALSQERKRRQQQQQAASGDRVRSCHVHCGHALLYGALPVQCLTGLVAVLELADERLSGRREAAAATLAAAVVAAAGAAYTYMGSFVRRDAERADLVRAYRVLAAENTAVVVLGVGGAFTTVYFDLATLPQERAAIARLAAAVFVAATGTVGYTLVHRRAAAALLVPHSIVAGVPAIVAASTALVFVVIAAPRHVGALGSYLGVGSIVALVAATCAVCARATRALNVIAVPLSILSACVFAAQTGVERYYDALGIDADANGYVLWLWWLLVAAAGTALGMLIATRCCTSLRADDDDNDNDDDRPGVVEAVRVSKTQRARATVARRRRVNDDIDARVESLLNDADDVDDE